VNINVFSKRLKAASVAFGLQSGSGKLFQADGPAMPTCTYDWENTARCNAKPTSCSLGLCLFYQPIMRY